MTEFEAKGLPRAYRNNESLSWILAVSAREEHGFNQVGSSSMLAE